MYAVSALGSAVCMMLVDDLRTSSRGCAVLCASVRWLLAIAVRVPIIAVRVPIIAVRVPIIAVRAPSR